MKLHITPGSPYARMARIVVIEKGLEDRVEVVLAATRAPDSPYYAINPSGRVPYLELGDGRGYEDSAVICFYLDRLAGTPTLFPGDGAEGMEMRRLEAMARSMLDGIAVWGREIVYRPEEMRSKTILEHEAIRAVASEVLPLATAAAAGTLDDTGWTTLKRGALEMVERQVAHIQKETMALLPLLEDLLDDDADRDLSFAYAAA